MYFSLTRFGWVSKSRISILIYIESSTIIGGYKIMELRISVPAEVLRYIDLPR